MVPLHCAAENMYLSDQVDALREEVAADEAEALRDDVALLRAEVIRLSDENKRLQSAPRVTNPPNLASHLSMGLTLSGSGCRLIRTSPEIHHLALALPVSNSRWWLSHDRPRMAVKYTNRTILPVGYHNRESQECHCS